MSLKLTIGDFAEYTGVSVRTLHYYDEIGLLKPAEVDGTTGYRYYDESSVLRMQEILFYRELDFPLRSIREILSSPAYDKKTALKNQQTLLILKKERLERLIAAIDGAVKGENVMTAFDNSEFEKTRAEVKAKWGHTDAYKQFEKKAGGCSGQEWNDAAEGIDRIMAAFAACMKSGAPADSPEADALVRRLQTYITEHFYDCTDPILAGLGQMYVEDDRFRENIDRYGAGTAAYIRAAIGAYLGK